MKPTFEQVAPHINGLPIHQQIKKLMAPFYGDYDEDSYRFNLQCVEEDYTTEGWSVGQWIEAIAREYTLNCEQQLKTGAVQISKDGVGKAEIGDKTVFFAVGK